MHVFPRDFKRKFPKITHGEGIYLYDETGKKYLDGASGAICANIGYGNATIARVISEQIERVPFAHGALWNAEENERAAEKILGIAPKNISHVWFVNSGSESTEAAVKMARQYHLEKSGGISEKSLVIGRENSYHGSTLGTLGIGGNVNRRRLFLPMFVDNPKIETHYCYRCPYGSTYPSCDIRCATELEKKINRIGAKYVAAFIAEPIIGSTAGAVVPPPEYWPIVREICARHDILLIADEVMTGCGRTGRHFCVDHWDVQPDIIATAKGLAACYFPVGATLVSEEIAKTFAGGSGVFAHSHTFNGMPAASAAICAVMDFYLKNDLCGNAKKQGETIAQTYVERLSNCPMVGDVRGKGLMWGIELVEDKETKKPFRRELNVSTRFRDFCLERGFTVYPGRSMANGTDGDNLIVGPPLVIDDRELKWLFDALIEALELFPSPE